VNKQQEAESELTHQKKVNQEMKKMRFKNKEFANINQ